MGYGHMFTLSLVSWVCSLWVGIFSSFPLAILLLLSSLAGNDQERKVELPVKVINYTCNTDMCDRQIEMWGGQCNEIKPSFVPEHDYNPDYANSCVPVVSYYN